MRRYLPLFLLVAIALGLALSRSPSRSPAVAYGAFGQGPSIVLVHGLGSTSAHWLPVARDLARDHRVTLVDLPGHGASAMPRPFSLEQATQSLDDALAAQDGPSVVVGHSLGGLVCAAEALAHPQRVRALVLVETALKPQIDPAERGALLHALDHDYARLVHAAYLDFGRDSTQGEALWQEVATLDPAVVKRWVRLAWTADLSGAAGSLRVPVLVVLAPRSWEDGETWSEVAEALGYTDVPRLRAVRLDRCGHFVMLDRPHELAALIEGFAAHPVTNELRASR